MVTYKSKVIHVEDDIIKLSPIRQDINAHTREDKNCGDDSSMFILDKGNLYDTVISDNTYLNSNKIMETIYLVLPYIHIGGEKYSIYSNKT